MRSRNYDTAYGLKSVCLRYFNAAGATERFGEDHDPETHLIPNVLSAAADPQREVRVFGNQYPTPDGTAIRDYIHVADLADAHIRALEHLRRAGASAALNLGTGHGYSVLEVIESARHVTGLPIRTRIEGPRPGDPACPVAEPSRATALLKWQPTMSDLNTIHSIGVGLAEKVSPRISPRSDRKVIPTFWPAVGFGVAEGFLRLTAAVTLAQAFPI
jgi:UDP-glucose 4-epimerase